jgi:hypothetical protein
VEDLGGVGGFKPSSQEASKEVVFKLRFKK